MQTYNFNPVNALNWLVNGQKEDFATMSIFSDKKILFPPKPCLAAGKSILNPEMSAFFRTQGRSA